MNQINGDDNNYGGRGNGNEQYQTLSKFDRQLAGLKGGNNLETKATTIENVNSINGESETFIVQTIRAEERKRISSEFDLTEPKFKVTAGEFVVLKYIDSKNVTMRIILPPKVTATIRRQADSLAGRSRSNKSRASMKERIANGWKPPAGFGRKTKATVSE